jgi:large subunit ribosomal protein L24
MRIKVDDIVVVMTGDDAGVRGKVLSVDRHAGKIVVEGVNRVYKHVRRSQRNPQGGRLSKEMPISASNVQLICPRTNKPTRVGVRFKADGSKERYAKRSGASLGEISPPKKSNGKENQRQEAPRQETPQETPRQADAPRQEPPRQD